MLIALEGIDQAGKGTQTALLADALRARGRRVETVSFPDYTTPTGQQIDAFLHGHAAPPPEVRHLLFAANRYERRAEIAAWLSAGATVLADRYSASGIAYGIALGLPRDWLTGLEARLPPAGLTILLDADPEDSRRRLAGSGDIYEQDVALLARCRAAYLELADRAWQVVDAGQRPEHVHRQILAALHA